MRHSHQPSVIVAWPHIIAIGSAQKTSENLLSAFNPRVVLLVTQHNDSANASHTVLNPAALTSTRCSPSTPLKYSTTSKNFSSVFHAPKPASSSI